MIHGKKPKGNDGFLTPDELYKWMNSRHNFELDVAALASNTKCALYFGPDHPDPNRRDGLACSWAGKRVFMNPPYTQKYLWIDKAIEETENNNCPIVATPLPFTLEIVRYLKNRGYFYDLCSKRISFVDPETLKPVNGNSTGTAVYYIYKKF